MSRSIVITSGKGGVGKTTVTANLAYRLAVMGERVLAADGDLGLNNLDVAMGVEGKVSYDFFDCMEEKCRPKQAVVQSPWHKNLFVMPACFGKNRPSFADADMQAVINELSRLFDYVLLDCPAGVDAGFRRAVNCCNEALVVITPHISSIRDADKVVNIISETKKCPRIIVNKMRGDLSADGEILKPKEIAELLKTDLAGVIPEDDGIVSGMTLGRGRSGRAFSMLASNVHTGKARLYDCESRYLGFFGSIRRKLKRIL